jgi:hypothetical protein
MNKQEIHERINSCSSIIPDLFKIVEMIDQNGITDSAAKYTILGLIRVYNSRFAELNRALKDKNDGPN